MSQNEYAIKQNIKEKTNSNDGMYFTYSDEPEKRKHSVFVERSVSGIYDMPCDNIDDESTSAGLGISSIEFKQSIFHENKNLVLLGIFIFVLIISSILFGFTYIFLNNRQGMLEKSNNMFIT